MILLNCILVVILLHALPSIRSENNEWITAKELKKGDSLLAFNSWFYSKFTITKEVFCGQKWLYNLNKYK
jgi:hypothetical protein